MDLCPFCRRDPYHYVDIGVGMQRAAVVCCDLGIALYDTRHAGDDDQILVGRKQLVEIAGRLEAAETEREAIANEARRYAGHYPQSSDGRNTFILLAEWIEARPVRAND
jgi:hypothetical protein